MSPEVSVAQPQLFYYSWQNFLREYFGTQFQDYPVTEEEKLGWIKETCIYPVRLGLDAIAIAQSMTGIKLRQEDHEDWWLRAQVAGGTARAFAGRLAFGDEYQDHMFAMQQKLNQAGEVGPHSYKTFKSGSYDVNLHFEPENQLDKNIFSQAVIYYLRDVFIGRSFGEPVDMQAECINFHTYMQLYGRGEEERVSPLRMRELAFSYGKQAFDIHISDSLGILPTFSLSVSPLDEELSGNMRQGKYMSQKQRIKLALRNNPYESDNWTDWSDVIFLTKEGRSDLIATMLSPDWVEEPHYVSYGQALYSIMRMILHATSWPRPFESDAYAYVEHETVLGLRAELKRFKNSNDCFIANDIKAQIDVIRAICFARSPELTNLLLDAFGILQ